MDTITRSYERSAQMSLFRQVYLWMAMALAITGMMALLVAGSPTMLSLIFSSKLTFFALIIAEIALVWYLSARIERLSFTTATLMFIVYSLLNGAMLSSIFILYTATSIASTFFVTAGTFGAMTLVGYTVKKDLSAMGRVLIMALIGLIIASIVNMFVASSALDWAITYIGVLVFVGLTAYDTQKIKQMMLMHGDEVNDGTMKLALMASLTLYLDFINLFLYLLRIFGRRE